MLLFDYGGLVLFVDTLDGFFNVSLGIKFEGLNGKLKVRDFI